MVVSNTAYNVYINHPNQITRLACSHLVNIDYLCISPVPTARTNTLVRFQCFQKFQCSVQCTCVWLCLSTHPLCQFQPQNFPHFDQVGLVGVHLLEYSVVIFKTQLLLNICISTLRKWVCVYEVKAWNVNMLAYSSLITRLSLSGSAHNINLWSLKSGMRGLSYSGGYND